MVAGEIFKIPFSGSHFVIEVYPEMSSLVPSTRDSFSVTTVNPQETAMMGNIILKLGNHIMHCPQQHYEEDTGRWTASGCPSLDREKTEKMADRTILELESGAIVWTVKRAKVRMFTFQDLGDSLELSVGEARGTYIQEQHSRNFVLESSSICYQIEQLGTTQEQILGAGGGQ